MVENESRKSEIPELMAWLCWKELLGVADAGAVKFCPVVRILLYIALRGANDFLAVDET